MPRLDSNDRRVLDDLLERGLLDTQEHARALRKLEQPRRFGVAATVTLGIIVGLAFGPAPLIAEEMGMDEDAIARSRIQAQVAAMGTEASPLTLAQSSAEAELSLSATVVVGTKAISLDSGASEIPLEETPEGLKIPDDEVQGQLISKLYDGLTVARERHSAIDTLRTGSGEFKGEILVVAHADTPFSVLRSVMYTAGQAQYGDFQIVVHNPWMKQETAVETTLPAMSMPGPPEAEPERPPLNLSMILTEEGITILGADAILHPDGLQLAWGQARPPTVPCAESDGCTEVDHYDWEETSRLLRLIKDEYPDDHNVIIVPDNDLSHDVLVRAIDVARWAPLPPEVEKGESAYSSWRSSRTDAFPSNIIAGGVL